VFCVVAGWLESGDWQQQLEQLLTVRQPSEDDLAEASTGQGMAWQA
jgi:hypothetical protein